MFSEVQTLSKKRKWDDHPKHDEEPEKPGFDLQNDGPFPSEWQRCLDIKSGQIYFYNTRTNKRAFGDPRSSTLEPSSNQAPMSLELELNPPCQSSAKNQVEHSYKRGDSGRETIDHTTSSKHPIKGEYLKGLPRSPSWLTIEGDQQEMVTAVCKKCYMLVMMCKSSPSCPNYNNNSSSSSSILSPGGLFLDASTIPSSVIRGATICINAHSWGCGVQAKSKYEYNRGQFMCLSLSSSSSSSSIISKDGVVADLSSKNSTERMKGVRLRGRGGAVNTTKHLWAGPVAAMVSRTCLAPLERLKLEYIVRGEKRNLCELFKKIATTQGLRGFWKGNFVNILRTAPFKAINFCAFDTYRKQLMRISGHEETTNAERFIAGAAAGITATVLCLPLDTIRTRLVAPGGESLGGVIGAFRHVVQTEGVFSLYKGLLPSVLSMASAGAIFYGVYDMLKSAYLHSPEGRKRLEHMKQEDHELNALEQLELGPVRTLLHGAIAGACTEAATYPFEVLRRQLQLQGKSTKLSTFATFVNIVEQGGVPALYAGLIPSLLQVLPSASISYFIYEFMKIVLKVE